MEDTIDRLYDAVGSDEPFRALVDVFYRGVEDDPVLRPLYPEDLGPARERLALFLIQRFGGPTTYSDNRGHPRLRMRHAPFVIGTVERDTWMRHMTAALDEVEALNPFREAIHRYFADTAEFLVNRVQVE
jgi:hemoglobin